MFQNLKKKIDSLSKTPIRTVANTGDEIRQVKNESEPKDSAGMSVGELATPQELTDASLKTSLGSGIDDAVVPSLGLQESNVTGDISGFASPQFGASFAPPSMPHVSLGSLIGEQPSGELAPKAFDLEEITEFARARDEETVDFAKYSSAENEEVCIRILEKSNACKKRLLQTVQAYKEMQSEKENLQVSLSRAEERHRRQLSELKEQIYLDQQGKRDLENNYSLMLDEKDEMIQILRMKVKLLKDGSSNDGKGSEVEVNQQLVTAIEQNTDASTLSSESQLKEKVKRLELLLTKCKDTIKANKERIQQLVIDRDAASEVVQEKTTELESFKELSNQKIAELQEKLKKLNDVNRETPMQKQVSSLETQNKLLQEKLTKSEKAGKDQLEKSREIIRQLKEQKNLAEEKYNETRSYEETLKCRINELLEENKKIKTDSEEKLKDLVSGHVLDLANQQEKILLEQETRLHELRAEHQQEIAEIVLKNEKLADISRKSDGKPKEDQELGELKQRINELERMVEIEQVNFNDQKEETAKIMEEKKNLEERTKELEQVVDSQHEALSKAETDVACLKKEKSTDCDSALRPLLCVHG